MEQQKINNSNNTKDKNKKKYSKIKKSFLHFTVSSVIIGSTIGIFPFLISALSVCAIILVLSSLIAREILSYYYDKTIDINDNKLQNAKQQHQEKTTNTKNKNNAPPTTKEILKPTKKNKVLFAAFGTSKALFLNAFLATIFLFCIGAILNFYALSSILLLPSVITIISTIITFATLKKSIKNYISAEEKYEQKVDTYIKEEEEIITQNQQSKINNSITSLEPLTAKNKNTMQNTKEKIIDILNNTTHAPTPDHNIFNPQISKISTNQKYLAQ